jgi:hypothetical protein
MESIGCLGVLHLNHPLVDLLNAQIEPAGKALENITLRLAAIHRVSGIDSRVPEVLH